jgi:hypothetical protein
MLLSILYSVEEVNTPNGPQEVDIHFTPITQYYTYSEFADEFHWDLSPQNAGEILGSGDHIQIEWNMAFNGWASLSVLASNYCNEVSSESLQIEVMNSVGLIDQQVVEPSIHPNPSNGRFILQTDLELSLDDVSIYAIDGRLINFKMHSLSNGYEIDLENNNGIYILKMHSKTYNKALLIEVY